MSLWSSSNSCMPDSTGFGDYCEAGQVIPLSFQGEVGGYQHAMYLNDHAPIAGGRELWGFPKKLGCPELRVHKDTLVGTLDFNGIRIATGTMGYKHGRMDSQSDLALDQWRKLLAILRQNSAQSRSFA